MMDPPWPETGGGGRGTGNHYETPAYDEIPAVVLGAEVWRPARAFWCGIWTTKTSLPHALELLRACGCRYVTTWTWWKTTKQGELSLGMGQYGRHSVEFLLWGKRGTIGRGQHATKVRADFTHPVGEHSAKPDPVYVDAAYSFAHQLEPLAMFERRPRRGWRVWGDEVP